MLTFLIRDDLSEVNKTTKLITKRFQQSVIIQDASVDFKISIQVLECPKYADNVVKINNIIDYTLENKGKH